MLEDLCNCSAPPGEESQLISLIREQLASAGEIASDLEIFEDPVGNLIIRREGLAPSVTVNASLDEAGLFITHIRDDGLLAFETAGILPHLLVGKRMEVGRRKIPGVIGFVPIHLQRRYEIFDKPVKCSGLTLDIGTTSKEETLKLVKPGEWAVFPSSWQQQGDVVLSPALDNRLAVAAAIRLILDRSIKNRLTVVLTRIRKSWPWGSSVAGEHFGSDCNLILDCCAADDGPVPTGQKFERRIESRLGQGPVLTVLDRGHIACRELFGHFSEVAESGGIPFQVKQSPAGMSEAGHYLQAGNGRRVLSLSVPCRYQNAPRSMARMSDLDALVRLAGAGIKALGPLEAFRSE